MNEIAYNNNNKILPYVLSQNLMNLVVELAELVVNFNLNLPGSYKLTLLQTDKPQLIK